MMAERDDEEERLRAVVLQNAQSILLARRRAEETLRKQSEWLRIALASIGDGVISTDAEGRVTFMNGVAEKLTGWSCSEAMGLPLQNIFHIVNERTRQPVENPALRALQQGTVVGLANHTLLIARDGSERAIDDSAAPMRDEDGAVLGTVLVFATSASANSPRLPWRDWRRLSNRLRTRSSARLPRASSSRGTPALNGSSGIHSMRPSASQ
jgi:PAS domain S-box-containing protein